MSGSVGVINGVHYILLLTDPLGGIQELIGWSVPAAYGLFVDKKEVGQLLDN